MASLRFGEASQTPRRTPKKSKITRGQANAAASRASARAKAKTKRRTPSVQERVRTTPRRTANVYIPPVRPSSGLFRKLPNSVIRAENEEAARVAARARSGIVPPAYGGGGGSGGGYGGGRGGASGGGGGGGGQGSSTTKPTTPAPTPAKEPTIDEARAQALKDALAAIAAEYGFNLADLQAQQGDLSNYFKMALNDVQEQERVARRGAIEDAVRRGIAQSSIYAKNAADVIKEGADTRAELTQEYGGQGSRARQLQSAINLLAQQKQAAETEARTTSAQGELDLETLLALIGTGIQGTNFAGV